MTEKRFNVTCDGDMDYSDFVVPCKRCERLEIENRQLRNQISIVEDTLNDLVNENEQLKQLVAIHFENAIKKS